MVSHRLAWGILPLQTSRGSSGLHLLSALQGTKDSGSLTAPGSPHIRLMADEGGG